MVLFIKTNKDLIMDITDYMIIKFIIICALSLLWGLYCGFTGRPLSLEPRDTKDSEGRD